jgi:hypothetical protein
MSKAKPQPMLTLYFKRAKLFLHYANGGEQRFVAPVTKEGPIQVPAWVAETETYRLSILDKSIVNLTPPEPVAQVPEEIPGVYVKAPEGSFVPAEDPEDDTEEDGEPETAKAPATKKPSRGAKLGLAK